MSTPVPVRDARVEKEPTPLVAPVAEKTPRRALSPRLGLPLLFAAAVLYHLVQAMLHTTPAIFTDELLHSGLAQAFASGNPFEIRGEDVFFPAFLPGALAGARVALRGRRNGVRGRQDAERRRHERGRLPRLLARAPGRAPVVRAARGRDGRGRTRDALRRLPPVGGARLPGLPRHVRNPRPCVGDAVAALGSRRRGRFGRRRRDARPVRRAAARLRAAARRPPEGAAPPQDRRDRLRRARARRARRRNRAPRHVLRARARRLPGEPGRPLGRLDRRLASVRGRDRDRPRRGPRIRVRRRPSALARRGSLRPARARRRRAVPPPGGPDRRGRLAPAARALRDLPRAARRHRVLRVRGTGSAAAQALRRDRARARPRRLAHALPHARGLPLLVRLAGALGLRNARVLVRERERRHASSRSFRSRSRSSSRSAR